MVSICRYGLLLSLPPTFSFCITTATLSVLKLTNLIVISLPFWTNIEIFYLQMPGGTLHLGMASSLN